MKPNTEVHNARLGKEREEDPAANQGAGEDQL